MSVISRLRDAGFEVYTRDEWGTVRAAEYERRKGTHPMPPGPARYHFLHITVTGDTDSPTEGSAGARAVESFGLSTPPMVSYQMLTTNEGRAYEGQNYGTKGTHTVNDKNVAGFEFDLNLHGYAVLLMQNTWDEVTDAQVKLIAAIFAAVELEGFVRRGALIYPHRMFAEKSCPGDFAVARLDEITRLKNQFVADGLQGGDDMPTPEEIAAAVWQRPLGTDKRSASLHLVQAAGACKRLADTVLPQLAEMQKAVDALPEGATKADVREVVTDRINRIKAEVVLRVQEDAP